MNVYNRQTFYLLFTLITYASGFSRGPPSFLVCSSLTPAHIGIGFSKQGASLKTSIIDHAKGLIKVSLSASKPFKGLQTLFYVRMFKGAKLETSFFPPRFYNSGQRCRKRGSNRSILKWTSHDMFRIDRKYNISQFSR